MEADRDLDSGSYVQVESGDEWCPSGCVLGLFHTFHAFIGDMEREIECTFSKFAGNTKLSRAVDTTQRWDAIQRHLELWPHKNLMKFKSKRKVLYNFVGEIPDISTAWEENSLRAVLQRGFGVPFG